MKQGIALLTIVSVFSWRLASSGSITVFQNTASPGSGAVAVKANAIKKVTLSISDTGANNLVSGTGIDFGDVDADGNQSSSGINGVPIAGGKSEYKTSFNFDVSRTGSGNVSLMVQRSVAGNFNSTDGVVVQDDAGAVQSLAGTGNQVSVLSDRAEGSYSKDLGVRIYSADAGSLSSTLLFTASAL